MNARLLALGGGTVLLLGTLWLSVGHDAPRSPSASVSPSAAVAPVAPAAVTIGGDAADDGPGASAPTAVAAPEVAAGGTAVALPAPVEPVAPPSGAPAAEPLATASPDVGGTVDFALDQRDLDAPETSVGGLGGPEEGPGGFADGAAIAVPSSYPVTDAAKYFVPREQRRPGNLGGPPPLDFPGGPNDPAGGGFAPPPAPGG